MTDCRAKTRIRWGRLAMWLSSSVHRQNEVSAVLSSFSSIMLLASFFLTVYSFSCGIFNRVAPLLTFVEIVYRTPFLPSSTIERPEALLYVKSFVSIHRNLRFVHIPKTGGTAIERLAENQAGLAWGKCMFVLHSRHRLCSISRQAFTVWHLPPSMFPLKSLQLYHETDLFAVTRDPIKRSISEVKYTTRHDFYRTTPDVDKYIQFRLQQEQKWRTYDCSHWVPQYDYIMGGVDNSVRFVDFILQLDCSMASNFDLLMTAYELPMTWPRDIMINAVNYDPTAIELSNETTAQLKNIYANDYLLRQDPSTSC